MSDNNQSTDELAPSNTAGYKVGEKKTVAELAQLDAQDESLRKWKESLGLKGAQESGSSDPRKVIVLALSLEVAGRDDVTIDLSTPEAIKALETNVLTIKEGIEYRLKVTFKIQHDVISGLKYLHVVKRGPLKVDKMEEMFPLEDSPSGMMARGTYSVKSRFIDDDGQCHLEWAW
eukprot:jgi/Hompol1/457/HPOL_000557-RA